MMRPDKAEIAYRVWSEPDPELTVLLVPGWRCQVDATYVDVLAHLEAQLTTDTPRLKIILPDTRGVGGSSMGETTAATFIRDELADKAAILSAERVGPLVWVGHSMGGMIGYEAALNAEGDMDAMVTICSPYTNPLKIWGLNNRISEERVLRVVCVLEEADVGQSVMGALTTLAIARRMALRVLHDVVLNRDRLDPQRFGALAHHAVREASWRTLLLPFHAMRAVERQPEEMAGLRIPVVVLAGGRDRFVRHDAIAEAARHMPSASFRLIPEVAHVPPLEAPAEVARAIIEAIDSFR